MKADIIFHHLPNLACGLSVGLNVLTSHDIPGMGIGSSSGFTVISPSCPAAGKELIACITEMLYIYLVYLFHINTIFCSKWGQSPR